MINYTAQTLFIAQFAFKITQVSIDEFIWFNIV